MALLLAFPTFLRCWAGIKMGSAAMVETTYGALPVHVTAGHGHPLRLL